MSFLYKFFLLQGPFTKRVVLKSTENFWVAYIERNANSLYRFRKLVSLFQPSLHFLCKSFSNCNQP